jgi:hypothetical protein
MMNWIRTLDTSLEQFLPTKLVQDNQQYTAQECKSLSGNDHQGNGQPLGMVIPDRSGFENSGQAHVVHLPDKALIFGALSLAFVRYSKVLGY